MGFLIGVQHLWQGLDSHISLQNVGVHVNCDIRALFHGLGSGSHAVMVLVLSCASVFSMCFVSQCYLFCAFSTNKL